MVGERGCLFFVHFPSFREGKRGKGHKDLVFLDESDSGIFGRKNTSFLESPEKC
jgi:hypothetical protein